MTDFEQAKKETAARVAELNQHVDDGVLDTVTALRMRGFNPIDACEGHDDRVTGGPYVMFEADGSNELMQKLVALQDTDSDEYKELYAKITRLNLGEVQKLLELVGKFYEQRDTPHAERLIIRCFGPSVPKLMCQNADLGDILDERDSKNLLSDNQLEMMAFTNYLKEQ
ncbi:MAG TPA: hypothetical protein VJM46_00600 [Candidatus Saccharimonadales bacterium]|nr:hypothetical protein [Candidatus Saccharimonadales bacterium]